MWQIFVGGIDSDVTDEDLRQPFSQFGEVVSVKMPTGKGCAFVQFANRYPCFPCWTGSFYMLSSTGMMFQVFAMVDNNIRLS